MTDEGPGPAPDLATTTAVAQRRLLEALATAARTPSETVTGTALLDVVGVAGVIAEKWDVAGDQVMNAVWRSVSDLAWAAHIDYRRSTMED